MGVGFAYTAIAYRPMACGRASAKIRGRRGDRKSYCVTMAAAGISATRTRSRVRPAGSLRSTTSTARLTESRRTAACGTSLAPSSPSINRKERHKRLFSIKHTSGGIDMTMMKRRAFLTSTLAVAAAASLPQLAFGKPLAPFKLFDTHAHFYTNEPDKYPFSAKGARYGAERMIAKAMATPMTPDVIFKVWDDVGIEMGCGVQYNSTYATDNRYLLDVSAKYPKRIVPVVILAATDPQSPP